MAIRTSLQENQEIQFIILKPTDGGGNLVKTDRIFLFSYQSMKLDTFRGKTNWFSWPDLTINWHSWCHFGWYLRCVSGGQMFGRNKTLVGLATHQNCQNVPFSTYRTSTSFIFIIFSFCSSAMYFVYLSVHSSLSYILDLLIH